MLHHSKCLHCKEKCGGYVRHPPFLFFFFNILSSLFLYILSCTRDLQLVQDALIFIPHFVCHIYTNHIVASDMLKVVKSEIFLKINNFKIGKYWGFRFRLISLKVALETTIRLGMTIHKNKKCIEFTNTIVWKNRYPLHFDKSNYLISR